MELLQVPPVPAIPITGWLSWPFSLALGFVVGMLLGRYLRLRRGWLVAGLRSLLPPLVVALALSMGLFLTLTLAAAAAGYSADFSGVSLSVQLAFLYSLSTRMEAEEPWWQFWRWRRPPPPLTRKQKKRRQQRRHK